MSNCAYNDKIPSSFHNFGQFLAISSQNDFSCTENHHYKAGYYIIRKIYFIGRVFSTEKCFPYTALISRLNGLDFLHRRDRKIECLSLTTWVVLIANWCRTWHVLSLAKSPGYKTVFTEKGCTFLECLQKALPTT